jgi:hypothetical protein
MGGPRNRSGQRGEEKILDITGTRTPTPRPSSPIASRYTGRSLSAVNTSNVLLPVLLRLFSLGCMTILLSWQQRSYSKQCIERACAASRTNLKNAAKWRPLCPWCMCLFSNNTELSGSVYPHVCIIHFAEFGSYRPKSKWVLQQKELRIVTTLLIFLSDFA